MKILYVGSEALPFASSGGLGDVLGSLPRAVKRHSSDDDVRVVMPLYAQIREEYRAKMTKVCEFTLELSWRRQYCAVFEYEWDGVVYYFIDNEYYFKRQFLYGSFDDGERFAFFCKAVLDMMPHIGYFPDILHCNDWQSALCVIYLERMYKTVEPYRHIRTVYTVHNIEYQGVYGFSALGDVFGLSEYDRQIVEYDGFINLSKGAIILCDRLTTVSPTYAKELCDPYFGRSLSSMIDSRRDSLCGIINGIDTDYYNPSSDPAIAARYDGSSPGGKALNKTALQRLFGLPEASDIPLIAMVSRLAGHKGFDLVRYIMEELLSRDLQFVLLGTGEGELEHFFSETARRYPHKVGVALTFDKELSKQIYAGADMLLMPSKTEPCGLSQMIASRYGTVPIVRETGGLYDTVKHYVEHQSRSGRVTRRGNGFTFATYNAHDMLGAIERAIELYRVPEKWAWLTRKVMATDFSWNASAAQYVKLYNETLIPSFTE